MTCTYCGHGGHTAPRCPRRPRLHLAPVALAIVVAAALGACGKADAPIDTAGLALPSPDLMIDPEPAPLQTAACDADKACRARYYTKFRILYGRVSDRTRGLQTYVKTIRAKGKA